jgi:hypothetical protein
LRPAYPRNVWNGTNITADGSGDPAHARLKYNTFWTTIVADGLITPKFTLALGRPGHDNASFIAFGECLPPVEVHGKFVYTPMLIVRT